MKDRPTPKRYALPLRGMPADRQSRLRGIPMGRQPLRLAR